MDVKKVVSIDNEFIPLEKIQTVDGFSVGEHKFDVKTYDSSAGGKVVMITVKGSDLTQATFRM